MIVCKSNICDNTAIFTIFCLLVFILSDTTLCRRNNMNPLGYVCFSQVHSLHIAHIYPGSFDGQDRDHRQVYQASTFDVEPSICRPTCVGDHPFPYNEPPEVDSRCCELLFRCRCNAETIALHNESCTTALTLVKIYIQLLVSRQPDRWV